MSEECKKRERERKTDKLGQTVSNIIEKKEERGEVEVFERIRRNSKVTDRKGKITPGQSGYNQTTSLNLSPSLFP